MRKSLSEKIIQFFGPVVLSALSIVGNFFFISFIMSFIDPALSLFATRGIGKITSTLVVLVHIAVFASTWPQELWDVFKQRCLLFLTKKTWHKSFLQIFGLFAGIHLVILLALGLTPYAQFVLNINVITPKILLSVLFGFIATFFLALTEEIIFRGLVLIHFQQYMNNFWAVIASAVIFSLAHDITAPWNLLSSDILLGVGLFLLGILLAQVACISGGLVHGMGLHAGLVFIKVIHRRIPLIDYSDTLPWWLNGDLRQSLLIHLLFLSAIITLFFFYRKVFILKPR